MVINVDEVTERVNRAVRIHVRCVALTAARRPQPPITAAGAIICPCSLVTGIRRRPALAFAFIKEILFRLRKAQAENPIQGIPSAAGAILPVIVIHHIRELDSALFLRREGLLQKIIVKPPPEIAVFPGDTSPAVILFAFKTVTAHQEGLIAVNLQNQPFNGLPGTAVVLGVTAKLNVLPCFDLHGLNRGIGDALYSNVGLFAGVGASIRPEPPDNLRERGDLFEIG